MLRRAATTCSYSLGHRKTVEKLDALLRSARSIARFWASQGESCPASGMLGLVDQLVSATLQYS